MTDRFPKIVTPYFLRHFFLFGGIFFCRKIIIGLSCCRRDVQIGRLHGEIDIYTYKKIIFIRIMMKSLLIPFKKTLLNFNLLGIKRVLYLHSFWRSFKVLFYESALFFEKGLRSLR